MVKLNNACAPLRVQFERFRRIFHHSTYRVLLGHKERKIMSSLFVEEVTKKVTITTLHLRAHKKVTLTGHLISLLSELNCMLLWVE